MRPAAVFRCIGLLLLASAYTVCAGSCKQPSQVDIPQMDVFETKLFWDTCDFSAYQGELGPMQEDAFRFGVIEVAKTSIERRITVKSTPTSTNSKPVILIRTECSLSMERQNIDLMIREAHDNSAPSAVEFTAEAEQGYLLIVGGYKEDCGLSQITVSLPPQEDFISTGTCSNPEQIVFSASQTYTHSGADTCGLVNSFGGTDGRVSSILASRDFVYRIAPFQSTRFLSLVLPEGSKDSVLIVSDSCTLQSSFTALTAQSIQSGTNNVTFLANAQQEYFVVVTGKSIEGCGVTGPLFVSINEDLHLEGSFALPTQIDLGDGQTFERNISSCVPQILDCAPFPPQILDAPFSPQMLDQPYRFSYKSEIADRISVKVEDISAVVGVQHLLRVMKGRGPSTTLVVEDPMELVFTAEAETEYIIEVLGEQTFNFFAPPTVLCGVASVSISSVLNDLPGHCGLPAEVDVPLGEKRDFGSVNLCASDLGIYVFHISPELVPRAITITALTNTNTAFGADSLTVAFSEECSTEMQPPSHQAASSGDYRCQFFLDGGQHGSGAQGSKLSRHSLLQSHDTDYGPDFPDDGFGFSPDGGSGFPPVDGSGFPPGDGSGFPGWGDGSGFPPDDGYESPDYGPGFPGYEYGGYDDYYNDDGYGNGYGDYNYDPGNGYDYDSGFDSGSGAPVNLSSSVFLAHPGKGYFYVTKVNPNACPGSSYTFDVYMSSSEAIPGTCLYPRIVDIGIDGLDRMLSVNTCLETAGGNAYVFSIPSDSFPRAIQVVASTIDNSFNTFGIWVTKKSCSMSMPDSDIVVRSYGAPANYKSSEKAQVVSYVAQPGDDFLIIVGGTDCGKANVSFVSTDLSNTTGNCFSPELLPMTDGETKTVTVQTCGLNTFSSETHLQYSLDDHVFLLPPLNFTARLIIQATGVDPNNVPIVSVARNGCSTFLSSDEMLSSTTCTGRNCTALSTNYIKLGAPHYIGIEMDSQSNDTSGCGQVEVQFSLLRVGSGTCIDPFIANIPIGSNTTQQFDSCQIESAIASNTDTVDSGVVGVFQLVPSEKARYVSVEAIPAVDGSVLSGDLVSSKSCDFNQPNTSVVVSADPLADSAFNQLTVFAEEHATVFFAMRKHDSDCGVARLMLSAEQPFAQFGSCLDPFIASVPMVGNGYISDDFDTCSEAITWGSLGPDLSRQSVVMQLEAADVPRAVTVQVLPALDGSKYNSHLFASTSCNLGDIQSNKLAENDNWDEDVLSKITFRLDANTTVFIVVAGNLNLPNFNGCGKARAMISTRVLELTETGTCVEPIIASVPSGEPDGFIAEIDTCSVVSTWGGALPNAGGAAVVIMLQAAGMPRLVTVEVLTSDDSNMLESFLFASKSCNQNQTNEDFLAKDVFMSDNNEPNMLDIIAPAHTSMFFALSGYARECGKATVKMRAKSLLGTCYNPITASLPVGADDFVTDDFKPCSAMTTWGGSFTYGLEPSVVIMLEAASVPRTVTFEVLPAHDGSKIDSYIFVSDFCDIIEHGIWYEGILGKDDDSGEDLLSKRVVEVEANKPVFLTVVNKNDGATGAADASPACRARARISIRNPPLGTCARPDVIALDAGDNTTRVVDTCSQQGIAGNMRFLLRSPHATGVYERKLFSLVASPQNSSTSTSFEWRVTKGCLDSPPLIFDNSIQFAAQPGTDTFAILYPTSPECGITEVQIFASDLPPLVTCDNPHLIEPELGAETVVDNFYTCGENSFSSSDGPFMSPSVFSDDYPFLVLSSNITRKIEVQATGQSFFNESFRSSKESWRPKLVVSQSCSSSQTQESVVTHSGTNIDSLSQVTFIAMAGEEYYVVVEGRGYSCGSAGIKFVATESDPVIGTCSNPDIVVLDSSSPRKELVDVNTCGSLSEGAFSNLGVNETSLYVNLNLENPEFILQVSAENYTRIISIETFLPTNGSGRLQTQDDLDRFESYLIVTNGECSQSLVSADIVGESEGKVEFLANSGQAYIVGVGGAWSLFSSGCGFTNVILEATIVESFPPPLDGTSIEGGVGDGSGTCPEPIQLIVPVGDSTFAHVGVDTCVPGNSFFGQPGRVSDELYSAMEGKDVIYKLSADNFERRVDVFTSLASDDVPSNSLNSGDSFQDTYIFVSYTCNGNANSFRTGDGQISADIVTWNDNFEGTLQSRVTFETEAGTDYYIVVSGKNVFGFGCGEIDVNFNMKMLYSSDDGVQEDLVGTCSNPAAKMVTANETVSAMENLDSCIADTFGGDPASLSQHVLASMDGPEFVIQISPSKERQTITVSTNSTHDSYLFVTTSCSPAMPAQYLVARNDDRSQNDDQSLVVFEADPEQAYFVIVSGFAGQCGNTTLYFNAQFGANPNPPPEKASIEFPMNSTSDDQPLNYGIFATNFAEAVHRLAGERQLQLLDVLLQHELPGLNGMNTDFLKLLSLMTHDGPAISGTLLAIDDDAFIRLLYAFGWNGALDADLFATALYERPKLVGFMNEVLRYHTLQDVRDYAALKKNNEDVVTFKNTTIGISIDRKENQPVLTIFSEYFKQELFNPNHLEFDEAIFNISVARWNSYGRQTGNAAVLTASGLPVDTFTNPAVGYLHVVDSAMLPTDKPINLAGFGMPSAHPLNHTYSFMLGQLINVTGGLEGRPPGLPSIPSATSSYLRHVMSGFFEGYVLCPSDLAFEDAVEVLNAESSGPQLTLETLKHPSILKQLLEDHIIDGRENPRLLTEAKAFQIQRKVITQGGVLVTLEYDKDARVSSVGFTVETNEAGFVTRVDGSYGPTTLGGAILFYVDSVLLSSSLRRAVQNVFDLPKKNCPSLNVCGTLDPVLNQVQSYKVVGLPVPSFVSGLDLVSGFPVDAQYSSFNSIVQLLEHDFGNGVPLYFQDLTFVTAIEEPPVLKGTFLALSDGALQSVIDSLLYQPHKPDFVSKLVPEMEPLLVDMIKYNTIKFALDFEAMASGYTSDATNMEGTNLISYMREGDVLLSLPPNFASQSLLSDSNAPGTFSEPQRTAKITEAGKNVAYLADNPFSTLSESNPVRGVIHTIDAPLIPTEKVVSLGGSLWHCPPPHSISQIPLYFQRISRSGESLQLAAANDPSLQIYNIYFGGLFSGIVFAPTDSAFDRARQTLGLSQFGDEMIQILSDHVIELKDDADVIQALSAGDGESRQFDTRGGSRVTITFGSKNGITSVRLSTTSMTDTELGASVLGAYGPTHTGGAMLFYIDTVMLSPATWQALSSSPAQSKCIQPSLCQFWDPARQEYSPYLMNTVSSGLTDSIESYVQQSNYSDLSAFQSILEFDYGTPLPLWDELNQAIDLLAPVYQKAVLLAPTNELVLELLRTLYIDPSQPVRLKPEMHDLLLNTILYNTLKLPSSSTLETRTKVVTLLDGVVTPIQGGPDGSYLSLGPFDNFGNPLFRKQYYFRDGLYLPPWHRDGFVKQSWNMIFQWRSSPNILNDAYLVDNWVVPTHLPLSLGGFYIDYLEKRMNEIGADEPAWPSDASAYEGFRTIHSFFSLYFLPKTKQGVSLYEANDDWDIYNWFNGGLLNGVVFVFQDSSFTFVEERLQGIVDFSKREAFAKLLLDHIVPHGEAAPINGSIGEQKVFTTLGGTDVIITFGEGNKISTVQPTEAAPGFAGVAKPLPAYPSFGPTAVGGGVLYTLDHVLVARSSRIFGPLTASCSRSILCQFTDNATGLYGPQRLMEPLTSFRDIASFLGPVKDPFGALSIVDMLLSSNFDTTPPDFFIDLAKSNSKSQEPSITGTFLAPNNNAMAELAEEVYGSPFVTASAVATALSKPIFREFLEQLLKYHTLKGVFGASVFQDLEALGITTPPSPPTNFPSAIANLSTFLDGAPILTQRIESGGGDQVLFHVQAGFIPKSRNTFWNATVPLTGMNRGTVTMNGKLASDTNPFLGVLHLIPGLLLPTDSILNFKGFQHASNTPKDASYGYVTHFFEGVSVADELFSIYHNGLFPGIVFVPSDLAVKELLNFLGIASLEDSVLRQVLLEHIIEPSPGSPILGSPGSTKEFTTMAGTRIYLTFGDNGIITSLQPSPPAPGFNYATVPRGMHGPTAVAGGLMIYIDTLVVSTSSVLFESLLHAGQPFARCTDNVLCQFWDQGQDPASYGPWKLLEPQQNFKAAVDFFALSDTKQLTHFRQLINYCAEYFPPFARDLSTANELGHPTVTGTMFAPSNRAILQLLLTIHYVPGMDTHGDISQLLHPRMCKILVTTLHYQIAKNALRFADFVDAQELQTLLPNYTLMVHESEQQIGLSLAPDFENLMLIRGNKAGVFTPGRFQAPTRTAHVEKFLSNKAALTSNRDPTGILHIMDTVLLPTKSLLSLGGFSLEEAKPNGEATFGMLSNFLFPEHPSFVNDWNIFNFFTGGLLEGVVMAPSDEAFNLAMISLGVTTMDTAIVKQVLRDHVIRSLPESIVSGDVSSTKKFTTEGGTNVDVTYGPNRFPLYIKVTSPLAGYDYVANVLGKWGPTSIGGAYMLYLDRAIISYNVFGTQAGDCRQQTFCRVRDPRTNSWGPFKAINALPTFKTTVGFFAQAVAELTLLDQILSSSFQGEQIPFFKVMDEGKGDVDPSISSATFLAPSNAAISQLLDSLYFDPSFDKGTEGISSLLKPSMRSLFADLIKHHTLQDIVNFNDPGNITNDVRTYLGPFSVKIDGTVGSGFNVQGSSEFAAQALISFGNSSTPLPGFYENPSRAIRVKSFDINSAVLTSNPFNAISETNPIKARVHVVDSVLIPRDKTICLGGYYLDGIKPNYDSFLKLPEYFADPGFSDWELYNYFNGGLFKGIVFLPTDAAFERTRIALGLGDYELDFFREVLLDHVLVSTKLGPVRTQDDRQYESGDWFFTTRGGSQFFVNFGQNNRALRVWAADPGTGFHYQGQVIGHRGPTAIGGASLYYIDNVIITRRVKNLVAPSLYEAIDNFAGQSYDLGTSLFRELMYFSDMRQLVTASGNLEGSDVLGNSSQGMIMGTLFAPCNLAVASSVLGDTDLTLGFIASSGKASKRLSILFGKLVKYHILPDSILHASDGKGIASREWNFQSAFDSLQTRSFETLMVDDDMLELTVDGANNGTVKGRDGQQASILVADAKRVTSTGFLGGSEETVAYVHVIDDLLNPFSQMLSLKGWQAHVPSSSSFTVFHAWANLLDEAKAMLYTPAFQGVMLVPSDRALSEFLDSFADQGVTETNIIEHMDIVARIILEQSISEVVEKPESGSQAYDAALCKCKFGIAVQLQVMFNEDGSIKQISNSQSTDARYQSTITSLGVYGPNALGGRVLFTDAVVVSDACRQMIRDRAGLSTFALLESRPQKNDGTLKDYTYVSQALAIHGLDVLLVDDSEVTIFAPDNDAVTEFTNVQMNNSGVSTLRQLFNGNHTFDEDNVIKKLTANLLSAYIVKARNLQPGIRLHETMNDNVLLRFEDQGLMGGKKITLVDKKTKVLLASDALSAQIEGNLLHNFNGKKTLYYVNKAILPVQSEEAGRYATQASGSIIKLSIWQLVFILTLHAIVG